MRRLKIILLSGFFAFILPFGMASAQKLRGDHSYKEWKKHDDKHYKKLGMHREKEWKRHDDKHYKKLGRYREKGWKHQRKMRRDYAYWARPHRYEYAHHVYFPDYEMFYDPYRDGYVYRMRNGWRFSRSVPSVYARVNFGRARMQVIRNIPVYREPVYQEYVRRYPRNPNVDIHLSF